MAGGHDAAVPRLPQTPCPLSDVTSWIRPQHHSRPPPHLPPPLWDPPCCYFITVCVCVCVCGCVVLNAVFLCSSAWLTSHFVSYRTPLHQCSILVSTLSRDCIALSAVLFTCLASRCWVHETHWDVVWGVCPGGEPSRIRLEMHFQMAPGWVEHVIKDCIKFRNEFFWLDGQTGEW